MTLDVSLELAAALLTRLSALRDRVAALVAHRSADDPTADDPLRGLYLSEEAVRHLLQPRPEPAELPSLADGFTDPLAALAARLRLAPLDTTLLLIALAPDLDRTFEQLYGYLNDDVGRRRATVGLALDLYGAPAHLAAARARFHPTAPLTALGLLTVEEPERPFLSRSLRVPDRVLAHLLGDDTPDAALTGHLREPSYGSAPADAEFTGRVAARIAAGPLFAYLRERREGEGLGCATAALRLAGRAVLHCTGPEERIPELLREARLSGRAILVESDQPASFLGALSADSAAGGTGGVSCPPPHPPPGLAPPHPPGPGSGRSTRIKTL
ncbi:ATP-binding protein, partial [Streptomyces sp. 900105755]